MNWATVAILILTISYLFYVGIIESISDSYRFVDVRVYHLFFFISGLLIDCQAFYCEEKLEIPYVITGFLFFCIGMAAAFWKKGEGILHVCFTYGAIAAGLTLTIVRIWPTWGWWSLSLAVLMGLAALLIQFLVKSNRVYWQEVAAYIIVFGPITTI